MLTLTINGVDYTTKWRVYESSWTMRAWQGESSQSQFILDDDDGSIDHANLAARKIVEVWEDASGASKCMYRGRVANKTLGMGPKQAPGEAMRWTVFTEDYNVDLKGIEVQGFERGEETDDERVEAVRLEYLNGLSSISPRARASTNLDGTYIGSDPLDAAPLYDETYTDTDPLGVLTRIVEMTGRVFFVYLDDEGDGELVYFNRASDADDLLSTIEVFDDGEVEGVDDVTTFAAYKGPQAGDHGGQTIMTGGSVRYQAGGFYRESNIDGRETTYDKWELTLRNDNIRREEAAEDYLEANVDASEETFTYFATIDMRAEYAHLIRAGMRVRIKRKRANQTGSQRLLVVTSQHEPVKPDAVGEALYRVTLEVGRPVNPHTTRSRFNIPIPPNPGTPGTPGSCTRYYFSTDTTGLPTVTRDASWDFGNGQNGMSVERGLLKATKGPTGTTSWGMGTHAVPINFHHGQFFVELPDAGTVEGFVKSIVVARRSTGIGTTSAQRHQAQMVIRVVSADGSTVRGTALAAHEPGVLDSAFFQSTKQTIKFPASSQWTDEGAELTPVANQAGDWLVVEYGSHTVVDGSGVGALIDFEGTTTEPDFPETEFLPLADGTAWIDICTAGTPGTPGDEPEDVGTNPDPGDDTDTFAPIDHVHGHGDVDYDGSIDHDARSIEYNNDESGLSAENVQDALDELSIADIAGGPHSHPDFAETAFAITAAPDGGWGRITNGNVVTYGDYTYIGYVTGDDGDVKVAVVANSDPSTVITTVTLKAALEVDDHTAPSLLVRSSDHKLLTSYSAHSATALYTRLSTTSLDTDPDLGDGFAAETNRDGVLGGSSYTFPHLFEITDDADIWLVYREGANAEWFRSISTDNGATFAAPTKILTESGETPYLKGVGNGVDRIDFVTNELNPSGGNASVFHFYYSDGDFRDSDGTVLTLPVDSSDATLVTGDGTANLSFMDIAQGVDGNPVIAYADISDTNAHAYYWVRWMGSAWSEPSLFVADAGEGIDTATETYSGHVALDGDNPTIVYASRVVDGEWEMYRYTTPDGTSWVADPLTADSTQKQIRPMSWAGHPDTLRVVWMDGDYTGFTTWDTGITGSGVSSSGGGGASALDDLTDVTITTPTLDDDLRYNGSQWVNDSTKWEAVTDGEDVFVWEGDDLVYEWST